MRWPPWKPDPDDVRAREEAERAVAETLAKWDEVIEAASALDHHMIRNHLVARAFAIREKGDR